MLILRSRQCRRINRLNNVSRVYVSNITQQSMSPAYVVRRNNIFLDVRKKNKNNNNNNNLLNSRVFRYCDGKEKSYYVIRSFVKYRLTQRRGALRSKRLTLTFHENAVRNVLCRNPTATRPETVRTRRTEPTAAVNAVRILNARNVSIKKPIRTCLCFGENGIARGPFTNHVARTTF